MFETLIKKYGKLKLRNFLLQIHPHLNKAQQKRNVKYIRATKFGATAEQKAAIDEEHKGWDSNPDIQPQDLGNSLNTIDFESAFIKGKTGPSTKNFVNRSDIITWKNNVLKPHAFQIKYKKPGVSNLIQLLLTVLLAEYTDDVEIQKIKETRFMRYMNNATCFELPGINIFGGGGEYTGAVFDDKQIGSGDVKEQIVKAELLMLLMRVFDMLHDFYDPGGRTGDVGKYMETFLKALVPVANMGRPGAPYYIVFYSFADQTYKNIRFPFYEGTEADPLSMDFALQFPGAFIEFIKQIQQNAAGRGSKVYNEELTQIWSDQLFHFNMVTVARNKFRVKRILQQFLYETDRQHVVLNDVANHYTKLMDLYHNIHIAPSTFTDANSTGGSKPITVRDLVKLTTDDGETIYYKLGGGLNTNRFIQGDARTKGAGMRSNLNLSDLYDITARQIIPDFLSNADAWKTEEGVKKRSPLLRYNDPGGKRSVVSCYYDTEIQFEKNDQLQGTQKESYNMHLRFIDSNKKTHILALMALVTPIVPDSKVVTNSFVPMLREMGWTVNEVIPNTKKKNLKQEFADKIKSSSRAEALEWLREDHEIDIYLRDTEGAMVLNKSGANKGKPKTKSDAALEEQFKSSGQSGELFLGAVFLCQTADGRGRIFIVDASLQFPGVDAIHKICRKIEDEAGYSPTLKLNYYAQLTTIKFYGDSSQAQTPLRHLYSYSTAYTEAKKNKSVLLTQGDTTSTLVSALQNRLLPLVYDNFRKCNVLGGHPENAGYGGLFTLPALDYVKEDLRDSPPSPPQLRGLRPPSPPSPPPPQSAMQDSPPRSPQTLPPGWEWRDYGNFYKYYKETYKKPSPIDDWNEDFDPTSGKTYWYYDKETDLLDNVEDVHDTIPQHIKNHGTARELTAPREMTPARKDGKGGRSTQPTGFSPAEKRGGGAKPGSGFGGSVIQTIERRPTFIQSASPRSKTLMLRLRDTPTEKINWKKPLTLDVSRLVKMPDGQVQFLRGIREDSLFKQLGVTTEYGRNEIRQRIIKIPMYSTNFGKRRWYVDRTAFGKLYRKQSCGCNPQWVTPQYYKKITGKSFWKLPTGAKVR